MPSWTPRATRIVNEDEGAASLQRKLHHVGDLGAVHLAGGAAGYREVLARQMNDSAIHRGASCDHSIGRQVFVSHAKISGSMFRKSADLLETFPVHKLFHAFACCKQASCVMLIDSCLAASLLDFRSLVLKFRDLSVNRRFRRWFSLPDFF
jgi:hypothetical protein